MKTHFAVKPPFDMTPQAACGRGSRLNDNTRYVDCLNCQRQDSFFDAVDEQRMALEAAFQAQTPRTVVPQFGRVNDDGVMECSACAGTLWRERPRDLFSYHYVCEGCHKSAFPSTETGMCT